MHLGPEYFQKSGYKKSSYVTEKPISERRKILLIKSELHDLLESLRTIRSKICQNFPVYSNFLLRKCMDEPRISCPVIVGSSVYADYPQAAELAFLFPAVSICMLKRLLDMVLRNRVYLATRSPVAFR